MHRVVLTAISLAERATEWMSGVWRPTWQILGHFPDKSFYAMDATTTNKHTHNNQQKIHTKTTQRQKTNTNATNWYQLIEMHT